MRLGALTSILIWVALLLGFHGCAHAHPHGGYNTLPACSPNCYVTTAANGGADSNLGTLGSPLGSVGRCLSLSIGGTCTALTPTSPYTEITVGSSTYNYPGGGVTLATSGSGALKLTGGVTVPNGSWTQGSGSASTKIFYISGLAGPTYAVANNGTACTRYVDPPELTINTPSCGFVYENFDTPNVATGTPTSVLAGLSNILIVYLSSGSPNNVEYSSVSNLINVQGTGLVLPSSMETTMDNSVFATSGIIPNGYKVSNFTGVTGVNNAASYMNYTSYPGLPGKMFNYLATGNENLVAQPNAQVIVKSVNAGANQLIFSGNNPVAIPAGTVFTLQASTAQGGGSYNLTTLSTITANKAQASPGVTFTTSIPSQITAPTSTCAGTNSSCAAILTSATCAGSLPCFGTVAEYGGLANWFLNYGGSGTLTLPTAGAASGQNVIQVSSNVCGANSTYGYLQIQPFLWMYENTGATPVDDPIVSCSAGTVTLLYNINTTIASGNVVFQPKGNADNGPSFWFTPPVGNPGSSGNADLYVTDLTSLPYGAVFSDSTVTGGTNYYVATRTFNNADPAVDPSGYVTMVKSPGTTVATLAGSISNGTYLQTILGYDYRTVWTAHTSDPIYNVISAPANYNLNYYGYYNRFGNTAAAEAQYLSPVSFTGSISGTTLTVSTLPGTPTGYVQIGQYVGSPALPGTQILGQISGTTGSTGNYSINYAQTQTISNGTLNNWLASFPTYLKGSTYTPLGLNAGQDYMTNQINSSNNYPHTLGQDSTWNLPGGVTLSANSSGCSLTFASVSNLAPGDIFSTWQYWGYGFGAIASISGTTVTIDNGTIYNGSTCPSTINSGVTLNATAPVDPLVPIVAASWTGGSATITTLVNHNVAVGGSATISGMTPSGYNGTYTAQSGTTGNTLVVSIASNPGTATVFGNMDPNIYTAPATLPENDQTTLETYNPALYQSVPLQIYIPEVADPSGGNDGGMSIQEPNGMILDCNSSILIQKQTTYSSTGNLGTSNKYLSCAFATYAPATGYVDAWNAPGTSAASILGTLGTIRSGEWANSEIPHALSADAGWASLYPQVCGGASTFDRSYNYTGSISGLCQGARLLLPKSVVITSLGLSSTTGVAAARALQDHGVCIDDQGSAGSGINNYTASDTGNVDTYSQYSGSYSADINKIQPYLKLMVGGCL